MNYLNLITKFKINFLFIFALSVILSIDCGYFLSNTFYLKRCLGYLWVGSAVGVFAFAFLFSLIPFFRISFWRNSSKWWYIIAFFLPIFLIYFDINGINWTPINFEGPQQAAIGLDLLKHDSALGLYSIGYYDRYVTRQYILAVMPAFFFGKSLITLRIGNSYIYVISYLAFISSLTTYLNTKKINSLLWASWVAMMISLGQYTLIQARMFEQTTFPIGATLMFLAALLYFLVKPTKTRAIWIAWSFVFLTSGYTPAYASWGLALLILLYFALNPKYNHKIFIPVLFAGIWSLLIVFIMFYKQGNKDHLLFKLGGYDQFFLSNWLWRYFSGFTGMFNADYSLIPVPLGISAFVVLFLSFVKKDYRVFCIFLWCIGVVISSLTFVGSWFNTPHYDIHRSIIILPFIALGVVLFYEKYYSNHLYNEFINKLAVCTIVYMVYTSLSFPLFNRWYYRNVRVDIVEDYEESIIRIRDVLNSKTLPPIKKLYITPDLQAPTQYEFGLVLNYLAPDIEIIKKLPEIINLDDPGFYIMRYNDKPRGFDLYKQNKFPRPYIVVEPIDAKFKFEHELSLQVTKGNGLLFDYQFTKGSGNLAPDNNNYFTPALLTNGVKWINENGKASINFDGNKNYMTLPKVNCTLNAMTILIDVKWDGGEAWQRILDFGDNTNTLLFVTPKAANDLFQLSINGREINAPSLPIGVWKHLCIVITDSEIKLYIDGNIVDRIEMKIMPTSILQSSKNWIGCSRFPDPYFSGSIRNLQIFNRSFNDLEIKKILEKIENLN